MTIMNIFDKINKSSSRMNKNEYKRLLTIKNDFLHRKLFSSKDEKIKPKEMTKSL